MKTIEIVKIEIEIPSDLIRSDFCRITSEGKAYFSSSFGFGSKEEILSRWKKA